MYPNLLDDALAAGSDVLKKSKKQREPPKKFQQRVAEASDLPSNGQMTYINQISVFNNDAVPEAETAKETLRATVTADLGGASAANGSAIESTAEAMIATAGKTYENFMKKKHDGHGSYRQI